MIKIQNITTDQVKKQSVVVTFQEMKKGTVLDLQFLPIFQLHLHTPDQTKISKQLLVLFFLKKTENI